MKKSLKTATLLCIVCSLAAYQTIAQNAPATLWNQYRGYGRAGVVEADNLPEKWNDEGLEQLWKIEVGHSFSEVVVSDEQVFVMSGELIDSTSGFEYLIALDKETGSQIWKTQIDSLFIDVDDWGNGTRATPVLDGERIYTFSGLGKLSALSAKTGKVLFTRDFRKEYGSILPRWGYSASPQIIDNLLIAEIGGSDQQAVGAFDKVSGELIWANGDGNASYCAPFAASINGETNILYISSDILYAFDTKGDTLWTIKLPLHSPMAAPVVFESNKIFISAVRSVGFCIVEVEENHPKIALQGSSIKNDFSSSCYYNGYIYGFNVAALQCVDPNTGERKWTKRAFGKGSLTVIGDKLIVFSDTGKLIYAQATPDAFVELASFEALDGRCWTAPSYSAGHLFVRNLTHVACYALK